MEKKLERDEQHKMIAGVCAGLADYFSVDVTVIRAIFVISLVLHGASILPYIILWIVMPKRITYRFDTGYRPGVDYTVPNNPFNNTTDGPVRPKRKSGAGLVVGMALIAFGAFFLLENFDLLPDWDFGKLWPVVLVAMGALLIFSPKNEKPWKKADWNANTAESEAEAKTEEKSAEEQSEDKTTDNPPTE
jgi:phage shock protein C